MMNIEPSQNEPINERAASTRNLYAHRMKQKFFECLSARVQLKAAMLTQSRIISASHPGTKQSAAARHAAHPKAAVPGRLLAGRPLGQLARQPWMGVLSAWRSSARPPGGGTPLILLREFLPQSFPPLRILPF
ncbi:hypothetical protein [Paraburkholderia hayleyella]|uniref:hypothetical protein n=1 Tax=Paraburkholderia hayleyella TaxID=2152889 RepID=UPI0012910300|nr:hypothetical protein [Paraburkholderia hayleyella]